MDFLFKLELKFVGISSRDLLLSQFSLKCLHLKVCFTKLADQKYIEYIVYNTYISRMLEKQKGSFSMITVSEACLSSPVVAVYNSVEQQQQQQQR